MIIKKIYTISYNNYDNTGELYTTEIIKMYQICVNSSYIPEESFETFKEAENFIQKKLSNINIFAEYRINILYVICS